MSDLLHLFDYVRKLYHHDELEILLGKVKKLALLALHEHLVVADVVID